VATAVLLLVFDVLVVVTLVVLVVRVVLDVFVVVVDDDGLEDVVDVVVFEVDVMADVPLRISHVRNHPSCLLG
jgi:hypothetical protein